MNWIKLGKIFNVENDNPFLISHASNPLAIYLIDDIFRIYYSGRNNENKSSIGFVDIDIIKQEVINYPKNPIITFGNDDSFYSHGISIGNSYSQNDKSYILFMGWQIRNNNHWRGDIGRLELIDNGQLILNPANAFIICDNNVDKISLSYPYVLLEDGIYKMWYGSTETWDAGNGEMIHTINYATSVNAIDWERHGIAIPYKLNEAQAFSKPSVIKINDIYHMWYSFRSGKGEKYRIGYSKSLDGINWERKHDECGIDVSSNSWDSEMICYPFVFEHKNEIYMLYNGNEYGKFGFGIAKLNINE